MLGFNWNFFLSVWWQNGNQIKIVIHSHKCEIMRVNISIFDYLEVFKGKKN